MPETISNTSPLQYLYQCNLLQVLPGLYGRVVVPEAVAAEIREGRVLGVSLPAIEELPWASLKAPKDPGTASPGCGPRSGGARGAGAWKESPGSLVILDDGLARRYAAHLGLRLIGTLGVLIRAKRQGLIAAVAPVLDQLERLRFRIAPATRAMVLFEAREPSGENP